MSGDLVQNLKRAGEQVLGAKGLTGNDHVRLSALLKVAALEIEALRAAEGVARDDAAELRAQVSRFQEALAFAQSVIKSGEPWSPTCDEIIGGALAATEGLP